MRFLVLFALILVLAGCEEAGKGYTYTPPETPGGRMCVNQCRIAHDYCEESCDLTFRGCISSMQKQALTDYDKYTRQQFIANEPMDLYVSDFERAEPCTVTRNRCNQGCESNYNMCYGNCGGAVKPAKTCPISFLCF